MQQAVRSTTRLRETTQLKSMQQAIAKMFIKKQSRLDTRLPWPFFTYLEVNCTGKHLSGLISHESVVYFPVMYFVDESPSEMRTMVF